MCVPMKPSLDDVRAVLRGGRLGDAGLPRRRSVMPASVAVKGRESGDARGRSPRRHRRCPLPATTPKNGGPEPSLARARRRAKRAPADAPRMIRTSRLRAVLLLHRGGRAALHADSGSPAVARSTIRGYRLFPSPFEVSRRTASSPRSRSAPRIPTLSKGIPACVRARRGGLPQVRASPPPRSVPGCASGFFFPVVVLLVLLRYPNGHDGKRNSPHPQLPTLS